MARSTTRRRRNEPSFQRTRLNRSSLRRLAVEPLEDRRLLAITVNTLVDEADGSIVDGDVSLRDALANATAIDTIDFSVSGTITLTLGELLVNKSLTINGPGADLLTIDGGNNSRIFNVDDGTPVVQQTVAIRGLTLTNGQTAGAGGAIRSLETLNLTDSVITNNTAGGAGGGVYMRNEFGSSNITDTTISNNTTSGSVGTGGGLAVNSSGDITITRSVISGNQTAGNSADGGGLHAIVDGGTLTMSESSVSSNSATGAGGDGGGLALNIYAAGSATIDRSTISANSTGGNFASGGGLFLVTSSDAAAGLVNTTVSGNQSNHLGGGVTLAFGSNASFAHSTVTDNTSDADGSSAGQGGGMFLDFNANVSLDHTIVAENRDNTGAAADISNSFGSLTPSFSLIGENSGSGLTAANPDGAGNLIGGSGASVIDPLLGPLTENGGPTQTHALRSGSPALDAGDATAAPGVGSIPALSQRGSPFTRVANGDQSGSARIDIGALEAQTLSLVVDSELDENDGDYSADNLSLREAIELTNQNQHFGAQDEVSFNGSKTITLGNRIFITDHLTISGPGANLVTISGGGATQIFRINDGNAATLSNVTIEGVTLTEGKPQGTVSGGAISANENLTLRNTVLTGNTATSAGGAIRQYAGALTVLDSDISENATERYSGGGISFTGTDLVIRNSRISDNAIGTLSGFSGDGGGVQFNSAGSLTIENTTISGNTTNRDGGGLFARSAASVNITDSTIDRNQATGADSDGAGLFLWDTISTVITGTTVSRNSAADDGGGVYFYDMPVGTFTITNSTISKNLANDDGGGVRLLNSSVVTIRHATIVQNEADADDSGDGVGGGIEQFGANLQLDHTIVADNLDQGVAPDVEGTGVPVFATFSLVGDNAGSGLSEAQTPDASGNLVGSAAGSGVIDPGLGFLISYGGRTLTHALLPGSPAINAGDPAAVAGSGTVPMKDQRSTLFSRVGDGVIDIGAFERQTVDGLDLRVDTLLDEDDLNYSVGDLSLREAGNLANGSAGADTILFDNALDGQTILMTDERMLLSEELTIDGTALPAGLTIDAQQRVGRIFLIVPTPDDITLAGLTLTGGFSYAGGALFSYSEGLLTFDRMTISGNATTGDGQDGGGVFAFGDVALIDSTISGNHTTGLGADGGGLSTYGNATLLRSTITGNSTDGDVADGGGLFAKSNATITDSIISDNNTAGYQSRGGGLLVNYQLTLTNSTVSGNVTAGEEAHGGGIVAGTLIADGALVQQNAASGYYASGGGIRTYSHSTIANSTISGNTAKIDGGGISALFSISVIDSTISENVVDNSYLNYDYPKSRGGGVYAFGDVNLNGATVSGNVASGLFGGRGGGVYSEGRVTLTNSTISGNSASAGGGIAGRRQIAIAYSTITANSAGVGGGIWKNDFFIDNVSMANSIVAANLAGTFPDLDPGFDLPNVAYSLIGDADGVTITGPGNIVGDNQGSGVIDPLLGPLADNGGPTQTHALLAGSPAANAGDPSAVAGVGDVPEFDQRGPGFNRILSGRIDMGAFESDLAPPVVDGDFNDDGFYDCLDIDALVVEIAAGTHAAAFDLSDDGLVDLVDLDLWLAEAGATNLGPGQAFLVADATLDGVVDDQDFVLWTQHRFQADRGWCGADFNADGVTDGRDLLLWNANKFQSSDVGGSASDESEPPRDRALREWLVEPNDQGPVDTGPDPGVWRRGMINPYRTMHDPNRQPTDREEERRADALRPAWATALDDAVV